MREIKFRVWDKDNNYMNLDPSFDYIGHQIYISMTHYTVMQYTGLRDKNGKEIYEGDVLKDTYDTLTRVVWWPNGCWALEDGECYMDGWSYAFNLDADVAGKIIVGNIYENPELVEKTS